MRTLALALLVVAGSGLPAVAQVEPVSLTWQLKKKPKPQDEARPADITELPLAAGAALKGRLQARLRLRNRGHAVEGVLLRYAVTARIDRVEEDGQEPAWSLPFMLEEKRVPKIGSNQFFETALDPTAMLALYLKRVHREGFWPRELKIQVLVAPRRDSKAPVAILENALPVRF